MGNLTQFGGDSLVRTESFPVEMRVLDTKDRLIFSEWAVATPSWNEGRGILQVNYDTDVTIYNQFGKTVMLDRLETYRDGQLFSLDVWSYKIRFGRGDSLHIFGFNSPQPRDN